MGKISPVSAKYIIHTNIHIDGTVDRPDIIGAIFGQTEGLLGSDLELRELQKSGRIGRIEVASDIKSGKTEGSITIPSSLDKTETAVVAAAMETIERIGPCNARVKVVKLEDVRISKRNFVVARAKELLRAFTENVLPDSQEITEEVSKSVRMMEIIEWGKDKLPAGPMVEEAEEIILVEGRADVLNLLKCGFKNAIGLNGTSIPETIKPLCEKKIVTIFVDGDRGGDLIIREAMAIADIDFVVKAPDGKELEELTKKEIHKALRGKITSEQAKLEIRELPPKQNGFSQSRKPEPFRGKPRVAERKNNVRPQRTTSSRTSSSISRPIISEIQKRKFKKLLEDLVGTRGAYILDEQMKILGKVPSAELESTLRNVKGIHTIIFDGSITKELTSLAEIKNVHCLVGMDTKVRPSNTKVYIITKNSF